MVSLDKLLGLSYRFNEETVMIGLPYYKINIYTSIILVIKCIEIEEFLMVLHCDERNLGPSQRRVI